jgi:hypothetical protein
MLGYVMLWLSVSIFWYLFISNIIIIINIIIVCPFLFPMDYQTTVRGLSLW